MTRRVQITLAPEWWARIDALNLVPRGARMTKARRRALTVELLIRCGLEEEEARLAARDERLSAREDPAAQR